MSTYLTKFETTADYTAFIASDYVKPNVSYIVEGNGVHYNPYVPPMNIITYEASAKLDETTSTGTTSGLHVNAFSGTSGQLTMVSHTFENGVGTIKFSDDVTSIGQYAFYNANTMTDVDLPNSVTSIGSYAFRDCASLTSIDIPNSVTSIGNAAFYYCSGLTSIDIPSGVTSISDSAFIGCSGLTSVTIGSGVTSIGSYAFNGCRSLTSIDIPNSVTSIGNAAFTVCSSLSTITSHIVSAPSVNNGTFQGVKTNGTLYVPIGSTGYDTWMNNQGNLGMYNWTKVEQ